MSLPPSPSICPAHVRSAHFFLFVFSNFPSENELSLLRFLHDTDLQSIDLCWPLLSPYHLAGYFCADLQETLIAFTWVR